ncbi:MAG: AraC family transcriptional regulator [Pontiellaceae bacterium]|nr:AraC family transcriptional regulator [Pontiellaceae bacterium]
MKKETHISYQERILRVQVHIQHHLDEPLSLEELARVACFSPYHFHRIFRGMVGESVAGHVRRLRLERAALKLKQTRQPIIELAFDAGFQTAESFTRAFKDQFGRVPSEYRKRGVEKMHQEAQKPTQENNTMPEVKIVELQEHRVAFVRHIGPYDGCGKAWDTLCTWAGMNGYLQPGIDFIGLCHDDPDVTPSENIRYDACITIDHKIEPQGKIGTQVIAGGLYAVTTHHGSFNKLSETYAALCGRWAPANGYELRSLPSREVYLNNPDETPEEELLTDIYVPIEK